MGRSFTEGDKFGGNTSHTTERWNNTVSGNVSDMAEKDLYYRS